MDDLLSRLRTALADRYTIEREIGRGGMAAVFLARDARHGRMVAIKVLDTDVSMALGAERFQREIAIAASLTHPHIVPLYEAGEAAGSLFYVMPFVEGESLRARLDREKQLPLEDAMRIACEVASALDYAHRHGVLHRDVKPANILLEDGHAVIADFGIARAISRASREENLTVTGVTLGTPTYMSPEQASGDQDLDGRSDIYALGCVLYEMLIGQPPFTGPSSQAVMARHAMETVPSLRIVRGAIPDEVEDAVMRALEKAPADRFATAKQFADALTGHSTASMFRHTATRRGPRVRRRSIGAVVGSVLVLVLAGIVGAWWAFGRNAGDVSAGSVGLEPRRIAVMYFDDASGSSDLGFLADGLTEALIDELKSVDGLGVVSRNGVARYRGRSVPLDSVAAALQVGTIVLGSVQPVRDRVKINVRIVDGNSGYEYDVAAFEQPRNDVLAMRDSLAHQVASLLRTRLGEFVRLRASRAEVGNPDVWSLLRRAERARKEARLLAAADSLAEATRRLELADSLLVIAESLESDAVAPILARADLRLVHARLTRDNLVRSGLIDSGLVHAERALLMEPRNAEGLEIRGTLRYLKRWYGLEPDPLRAATLLRTAEEDLRLATTIDRTRASAFNLLSLLLYRQFDRLGANLAAQRAYEADAFLESAKEIIWRLYATSYDLEQIVQAANWCEHGRQRFPNDFEFVACRIWLLTTNARPPDVDGAWRDLRELESRVPPGRWEGMRRSYEMLVAVPIARAGLADSARRVIERARAGPDVDPRGELLGHEALVRTLIGDREEALELLASYLAARPDHREGFTRGNTWWWKSLEDDPRFKALAGS